jgi:hypothetical protein
VVSLPISLEDCHEIGFDLRGALGISPDWSPHPSQAPEGSVLKRLGSKLAFLISAHEVSRGLNQSMKVAGA